MRTHHFLVISLSLIVGAALCTNGGCRKQEPAGDTSPRAAGKDEAPATPAQAEEMGQPVLSVKPAPDANTIAEGHAFPSLQFASLSGDQVNLATLKGKAVLIDFWATWCGPCRQVMPDLVETYRKYHGQGFEIIGISLDKDQAQLEKYMQDTGITWPQYYDGLGWSNKIAKRFGIRAIPHVVLVDKNGAVHFNTDYGREKPPLHGLELRNAVAQLCSAPAP